MIWMVETIVWIIRHERRRSEAFGGMWSNLVGHSGHLQGGWLGSRLSLYYFIWGRFSLKDKLADSRSLNHYANRVVNWVEARRRFCLKMHMAIDPYLYQIIAYSIECSRRRENSHHTRTHLIEFLVVSTRLYVVEIEVNILCTFLEQRVVSLRLCVDVFWPLAGPVHHYKPCHLTSSPLSSHWLVSAEQHRLEWSHGWLAMRQIKSRQVRCSVMWNEPRVHWNIMELVWTEVGYIIMSHMVCVHMSWWHSG